MNTQDLIRTEPFDSFEAARAAIEMFHTTNGETK